MKFVLKVIVFSLIFGTVTAGAVKYSSSYDIPVKCKMCGHIHIPGVPCPKK